MARGLRIEKRRHVWHALFYLPQDVRHAFQTASGARPVRLVRSLRTRDIDVARVRAAAFEAECRRAVMEARGEPVSLGDWTSPARTADELRGVAEQFRAALKGASPEERAALLDLIQEEARDYVQLSGLMVGVHTDRDPDFQALPAVGEAKQFIGLATGTLLPFDQHLEEYAAPLKTEPKSKDMMKSTIRKFTAEFPTTSDVTRKAVQRWVNRLAESGKAVATIRRSLSELRGYWAYLKSIEEVPDDVMPFTDLTVPKASKRGGADTRQPFAPAEVRALLAQARAERDTLLGDAIELAMWTGARIEELCAITLADVKDLDGNSPAYFRIQYAKSQAGVRGVPIHSRLRPLVNRLVAAASLDDDHDGFLLAGLRPNKYGDRSGPVSKRFSRLRTAAGFGPEHVFHSIRKTVSTMLENAGVPENVAADILGHDKPTMTYGLYSGGTSIQVRAEAVERLRYEAEAVAA